MVTRLPSTQLQCKLLQPIQAHRHPRLLVRHLPPLPPISSWLLLLAIFLPVSSVLHCFSLRPSEYLERPTELLQLVGEGDFGLEVRRERP
jgi:hypothetical protein